MGIPGQENNARSREDQLQHHHELHEYTVHGKIWRNERNSSKIFISQYQNGKLNFDRPVELSGEVKYKLTGLSNQGDLVPIGIKEGLVE